MHLATRGQLSPGEWVRLAIPSERDGSWHRFHGRVLRADDRRASIALVAPAGVDREAAIGVGSEPDEPAVGGEA